MSAITKEQIARFIAEIPSAEWLAEHGYSSPQEYAYGITSDAYKDANGIRCRWMAQASIEELASLYFQCVDDIVAQARAEQEAEAEAKREAELEARLTNEAFAAAINPSPFGLSLATIWPA
jgi:hypothetical protein